jgi:hypothetical protein
MLICGPDMLICRWTSAYQDLNFTNPVEEEEEEEE